MDNRWWWLGIDAARNGGAALISPHHRLTVVWCWLERHQDTLPVYDVAICQDAKGRVERVKTLHDVAELIRKGTETVTGRPTWGVCIESTFVHNNLNTTLSLAHTQGKFEGPLERHAPGRSVMYVSPSAWRKVLFPKGYRKLVQPIGVPKGKPPKPKHYDKAASFKFIPPRLPPIGLMLRRTGTLFGVHLNRLDDITDAGGIAEYGRLHEQEMIDG